MTMTRTRHLTLVTLLLTMTRAADSQQPSRPTTLAHRSTVYAPHGMIATSQPLATAAGLAVLERGGNAVDAAVTAAAVLNVGEPPMTGIGGDIFAIVWSAKDRKLYGLNASGRAGGLMTRDALLAKGPRHDAAAKRRGRDGPGSAVGMGRAAQSLRDRHAGAGPRTGHRLRRAGLSGHPDHQRRVGRRGRPAAAGRGCARDLSRGRGPGPAARRMVP